MAMADIIKGKLAALEPESLEIINESGRHAGHAGDNGTGESHFKLKIVSGKFDGLSRVERQKLVCTLLAEELKCSIHALSIRAITPQENFKK